MPNGHSESISGLSSIPKYVTFTNAKSISIENADSLTVDYLTSTEPNSDAVIWVYEFESVLQLALINSHRELSSKIEPNHIL